MRTAKTPLKAQIKEFHFWCHALAVEEIREMYARIRAGTNKMCDCLICKRRRRQKEKEE